MFTRQALGVEMSQRRALCLQVPALGCQKVAGKVMGRQRRAPGGGPLCPRLKYSLLSNLTVTSLD